MEICEVRPNMVGNGNSQARNNECRLEEILRITTLQFAVKKGPPT